MPCFRHTSPADNPAACSFSTLMICSSVNLLLRMSVSSEERTLPKIGGIYGEQVIGYTLTGSVREEMLLVLHGTGSNGKSTFRETVHSTLGDYALAADAALLTERKKQGGATEEI